MIAHFSLPARDPQRVAHVFARLIDGEAMPFPVVPGAWVAIARDGSGCGVEVLPDASAHTPGAGDPDLSRVAQGPEVMPWEVQIRQQGSLQEHSGFHVALSSPLSTEEILAIGRAEGWRSVHCERGGVFDLVEVWVENHFMLEVLPPQGLQRYLQFYTPDVAGRMFATPPAH